MLFASSIDPCPAKSFTDEAILILLEKNIPILFIQEPGLSFFVGLLGLEPRLFCTKNRRVASYTIDQSYSLFNLGTQN